MQSRLYFLQRQVPDLRARAEDPHCGQRWMVRVVLDAVMAELAAFGFAL